MEPSKTSTCSSRWTAYLSRRKEVNSPQWLEQMYLKSTLYQFGAIFHVASLTVVPIGVTL